MTPSEFKKVIYLDISYQASEENWTDEEIIDSCKCHDLELNLFKDLIKGHKENPNNLNKKITN